MYMIGLVALAVVAAVAMFFGLFRLWQLRWGATAAELAQKMPGDEIVRRPVFNATLAVTVNARPQDMWPWIVQLLGTYSPAALPAGRFSCCRQISRRNRRRDGSRSAAAKSGDVPITGVIDAAVTSAGQDREASLLQ